MNEIGEVICPDCKKNVISVSRYNSGKVCVSCTHRMAWAARKGEPYIKYKDLSKLEKQRITETKAKVSQAKLKRKLIKLSIIDTSELDSKKTKGKNGVFQVSMSVKDYIDKTADKDLSIRELYGKIIEHFNPIKLNLDVAGLQKYIHRKKLPFRKCTSEERQEILAKARAIRRTQLKEEKPQVNFTNINKLKEEQPNNLGNIDNKSVDESDSVQNISSIEDINESDIISTSTIIRSENKYEDEYENRFKPIEVEVQSVLNKKFKEVGCELGYDFSVEDYINALIVLRYLINNYQDINSKRNDQWDIANRYQTDIVHEMEAVVSAPGDTYMQDKCHVLRNIRRKYELDKKAIEIMKPFLTAISNRSNEITSVLNKLKIVKESKDDLVYVPNVDTTMVDKYDWAKATNVSPKLMQKSLLTSNNKFNRRKGDPIFKVSCYLSGNGYGTFKFWSKEYSYPTEEEADKVAKMELDNIKKRNGGLLVSNYKITKMNKYYDKSN